LPYLARHNQFSIAKCIYLTKYEICWHKKHWMREDMLTEPQFKVLLILFDDKGHAGWELAKDLHKAESNLNPYLIDLMNRKLIFQGPQRISTKPKRREGNYKEIPYYLNKDLKVLGTIIKEMVVTNRVFDTGFPFRVIRASNYITSMKKSQEEFNEFIAKLFKESHLSITKACTIADYPKILKVEILPDGPLKELYLLSFEEEMSPIKERRVTEKLLNNLEL
jgi:hypothetical protein